MTILPQDLTTAEREALPTALSLIGPGRRPWTAFLARKTLQRHLQPLVDAAGELSVTGASLQVSLRRVMAEMATTELPCSAWTIESWAATARAAGCHANALLALACHLDCISGADAVSLGVQPTYLARRLFSRAVLDREVDRIVAHLTSAGYRNTEHHNHTLPGAVARLFLVSGCCELEALSIELIEQQWRQTPSRTSLSRAYFRIGHALHGMGLVPRGVMIRDLPLRSVDGVDPAWAELANRWLETSTLQTKSRDGVFYGVLRAGRWLAAEHPSVTSPEQWTRELAAAYVAAVDHALVGDLASPSARPTSRRGLPLAPRSKDRILQAVRIFFRDCRDWEWCRLGFDPQRAFATPRSVLALMDRDPRVIADDVWAKLLWAGLNLEAADQPQIGDGSFSGRAYAMYPLAMIKALTVAWLFAGLRVDELVRLRVGCIRWQRPDGGPAASSTRSDGDACLLDVPIHKTGRSYTKPVDPIVGDMIGRWEADRLPQPRLVDRKTGQPADLLFAFKGRSIPHYYVNRSVIPMLCRKAGVPLSDARGRITGHRARSTIASQLYNAKEPMTLFELQAWLGHRSPHTTQYYVRINPTKLVKAYTDAGYFGRNVRAIEVLLDRDAVQRGSAGDGQPWQFFDLGHGYCTYTFFEQCPHRMACAKCDFYLPKDSSHAQLLEAKANLQRMLVQIPLSDDERAAVEEGDAAVDRLLAQLADVPTPAGPTPRQLAGTGLKPLPVLNTVAAQRPVQHADAEGTNA